jgi:DsbE subfamily thiol:disulfide oxidoreductase
VRGGAVALTLIGLLAGCSLQQPLTTAEQSRAQLGKPAPDFNGADLDGKAVRLSDFKGKAVVLNFWASWCGPCRAEQPALVRVAAAYKDKGVEILGVDVRDNVGQAKVHRDEFKVPYPSVYDQAGHLEYAYSIDAPPSSVFIDAKGIVVYQVTGALDENAYRDIIDHKVLKS